MNLLKTVREILEKKCMNLLKLVIFFLNYL